MSIKAVVFGLLFWSPALVGGAVGLYRAEYGALAGACGGIVAAVLLVAGMAVADRCIALSAGLGAALRREVALENKLATVTAGAESEVARLTSMLAASRDVGAARAEFFQRRETTEWHARWSASRLARESHAAVVDEIRGLAESRVLVRGSVKRFRDLKHEAERLLRASTESLPPLLNACDKLGPLLAPLFEGSNACAGEGTVPLKLVGQ